MKKKFTIIVLLFGALLNNYAQISLTYKNHAIKAGSTHHFILAENANEGSAGMNQTWDFTNLKAKSELTSEMLPANETLNGIQIPNANSVIKEFDNNFYFRVTKYAIEEYGFASCGNVYKYDKPLVKMKFPFRYGDKQQGEFAGVNVANPEVVLRGTYKIEADAFGKLKLPGNVTYKKVIRLKSTRTDGASNSGSSVVTYRWYSSDVRYPLLTIIKTENSKGSATMLTAYHDASSLSKEKSAEAEDALASENEEGGFSVFPVPFDNEFSITYTLPQKGFVKIELLDNFGKPLKTIVSKNQAEGDYKEEVSDLSNLAQGVYFIKANIDGKKSIKKMVKL